MGVHGSEEQLYLQVSSVTGHTKKHIDFDVISFILIKCMYSSVLRLTGENLTGNLKT